MGFLDFQRFLRNATFPHNYFKRLYKINIHLLYKGTPFFKVVALVESIISKKLVKVPHSSQGLTFNNVFNVILKIQTYSICINVWHINVPLCIVNVLDMKYNIICYHLGSIWTLLIITITLFFYSCDVLTINRRGIIQKSMVHLDLKKNY